jgi:hypothetical protein
MKTYPKKNRKKKYRRRRMKTWRKTTLPELCGIV